MGGDDSFTGTPGSSGGTVSYVHASAGVTVDLNLQTVANSTGTAHGTAPGDLAGIGTDTFFGGVQVVRGSDFDDTLLGSNNVNGPEVFEGRGGNDNIDGRGGFDRVFYEFRLDDNVTGGVVVNLAAGTVDGDASIGSDTLRSIEAVRGTNFVDIFTAAEFRHRVRMPAMPRPIMSAMHSTNSRGWVATTPSSATAIRGLRSSTRRAVSPSISRLGRRQVTTRSAPIQFRGISILGSSFKDTWFGSTTTGNTSEVFDGGTGDDFIVGRGGFDQAVYKSISGRSRESLRHGGGHGCRRRHDRHRHAARNRAVFGTNFVDVYGATNFDAASDARPWQRPSIEFEGNGGNDTITGNGDTRIRIQALRLR